MIAHRSPLTAADLPERRLVAGFEGGSVSTAERFGRFYLLIEESTLVSLLSEEDQSGLCQEAVYEFDSAIERTLYLRDRFGIEQ